MSVDAKHFNRTKQWQWSLLSEIQCQQFIATIKWILRNVYQKNALCFSKLNRVKIKRIGTNYVISWLETFNFLVEKKFALANHDLNVNNFLFGFIAKHKNKFLSSNKCWHFISPEAIECIWPKLKLFLKMFEDSTIISSF